MPLANEHTARVRDPDKYIRVRRVRNHFGAGIHVNFGILRRGDEEVSEIQSIHFDAARFTASDAKAWLRDHKIKWILFEPATGKESMVFHGGTRGERSALGRIVSLPRAYGRVNSLLGFPLRDDVATAVDQLLTSVPAELRAACRASVITSDGDERMVEGYGRVCLGISDDDVSFDDDGRTETSLVTTAALDRQREVVQPDGCDWSLFAKNAVVTFAHDYGALPVGRCVKVERARSTDIKRDGWAATTRYFHPPTGWKGDWFPDAVMHLVRSGMRGKSIGFIPTEGRPISEEDVRAHPEWAGGRFMITRCSILEYAVAPIPANPEALARAIIKCHDSGLVVPERVYREAGIVVPDDLSVSELEVTDGVASGESTPRVVTWRERKDARALTRAAILC